MKYEFIYKLFEPQSPEYNRVRRAGILGIIPSRMEYIHKGAKVKKMKVPIDRAIELSKKAYLKD